MSKSLDEIPPPTKAVKIKRREKPRKKEDEGLPFTRRRIKKDVMPPPAGEMPAPSEEAVSVAVQDNRAQSRLLEAMRSVNRLMAVRVLSDNRSVQDSDDEKQVVQELVQAAMAVEELSPGEGLLGMATLAIRQGLSLRDAGNRLAYELHRTREELQIMRKHIGELRDGEKKLQS